MTIASLNLLLDYNATDPNEPSPMPNKELRPVKRSNLSETVYSEIRNALMEGQYEPGERLRINSLAVELGVSITPVREAIFRLVSDQALEMKAATAIHVSQITVDQLREIQAIRILLEGYAAEIACQVATADDYEKLAAIHKKFQETAQSDPIKASALNRKFHFGLMRIAKLPVIFATVENMWVIMGPLLRVFHQSSHFKSQPSDRHLHLEVLEALKIGDSDLTKKAIQDDIRLGLNLVDWIEEHAAEHTK